QATVARIATSVGTLAYKKHRDCYSHSDSIVAIQSLRRSHCDTVFAVESDIPIVSKRLPDKILKGSDFSQVPAAH
ncbi:MAG: hypothetical protein WA722_15710, partial [Candidatus Sulfotelmatobacter sp.]